MRLVVMEMKKPGEKNEEPEKKKQERDGYFKKQNVGGDGLEEGVEGGETC